MAETGHVAPPVLPTKMVLPLPAWSVFDEKEETIFRPSDILSGGMNSWVEFASSRSREFTHSQEPKESEG